jgi:Protease inhibitor Inh
MTKLTSLALGAGLALASISLAHADPAVTGAWKLTVGVNDAPCTLTLTPDANGSAGQVATGSDCPSGLYTVTAWKTVGPTLELYAPNGELIASFKAKGDTFVGSAACFFCAEPPISRIAAFRQLG